MPSMASATPSFIWPHIKRGFSDVIDGFSDAITGLAHLDERIRDGFALIRETYQSGAVHVAQSFAVPTIATAVGAFQDVIEHEASGLPQRPRRPSPPPSFAY